MLKSLKNNIKKNIIVKNIKKDYQITENNLFKS